MSKIEDIQDYIDDAFDVWPELNCNLDGLLGYVEEYNDCFMTRHDNQERAIHVILFVKKAAEQGCEISEEIKAECRMEMDFLKENSISLLESEIKFLQEVL